MNVMTIRIKNVTRALEMVERLSALHTPEEEFETLKDRDGHAVFEGVTYDDVEDMLCDMSDDRLVEEYGLFMDFIREAKELMQLEEQDD